MPTSFGTMLAAQATRISSRLGPRGMRVIAKINKRVTNPIQLLWAPRLRHYAVLEHRGRKSGARYRTPVMVFLEEGTATILINYGPTSDWVRNTRTANSATLVHRRTPYRLTDIRILPTSSPDLPAPIRAIPTPNRYALTGTVTKLEELPPR